MKILRQKEFSKKKHKMTKRELIEDDVRYEGERYKEDLDKLLRGHRLGSSIGFSMGGLGVGLIPAILKKNQSNKEAAKNALIGGSIGAATGLGVNALYRRLKKSKEHEESERDKLVEEYKKAYKKYLTTKKDEDLNKASDYKYATQSGSLNQKKLMKKLTGSKIYE